MYVLFYLNQKYLIFLDGGPIELIYELTTIILYR